MKVLEDFKMYLMEDGKSPKTIQSYIGDVAGLVKYLEAMGTGFEGSLKRFYVTSYKNYLLENSYEPATINNKINSIQAFNYFLIEKGYIQENIVDLKKYRVKVATGSEHQAEVLTENQCERLLFYIQNQKKVNLRDNMIIELLMFTGVRVSELCSIKIKNIDFLTGHIKIIRKGGKVREIPLKVEVMETIKEYLVERNSNPYRDSEYLILGQRGAIQRDAVKTLLENLKISKHI
jgi:integrase/recombinase XerD